MKWIVKTAALALTFSVSTALAQTTKPDVSAAPSVQHSGAGIAGAPGNKNGPAAKPGDTVGSSMNEQNPTVQQQDPSNIKSLPGNRAARPPSSPTAGDPQCRRQE